MKKILISMVFFLWTFQLRARPPEGPIKVKAVVVQQKKFFDEVEALGTLKAQESVDISATVTELITKIHFEDGQRVQKGDLLVEMDTTEELAKLSEEKAKFREAQKQYKRLKPLVKKGAASASTLDQWQSQVESSKARIDAIEAQMALRTIRAPFDGALGLREISVGALASPGTMITSIDDDKIMRLDFSVPELFLSSVQKGVRIEAESKAFPNKTFRGEIDSIDSRIDEVSRAFKVRALLSNEDRVLRPGLLMNVLLLKKERWTLLVPEETILSSGIRSYVYKLNKQGEHHIVEKSYVNLGSRRRGEVEILEGLKENDLIMTHGSIKTRPGAKVFIEMMKESKKDSRTYP